MDTVMVIENDFPANKIFVLDPDFAYSVPNIDGKQFSFYLRKYNEPKYRLSLFIYTKYSHF